MKMFLIYDARDKTRYILLKAVIFAMIAVIGLLVSKNNVGIPIIILLAYSNRLKPLFKIKSIGFAVIAFGLYFLREAIEPLSLSLLLVSIPLLIDDLVVENYFRYLNMTKYFEKYKYVGAHHD